MTRGTILYVGNFELPDKGASANRVTANKKLFEACGWRVVLLGVTGSGASGLRGIGGDMYERPRPRSTGAWLRHSFSLKTLKMLAARYPDTRMILLYNAPYFTVRRCAAFFHRRGVRVCYDCTEWSDVTDGGFLKRRVKALDAERIRTRLPTHTDGLIVVSRMMLERYGQKRPTVLLPPLVDTNDPIWRQRPPEGGSDFEFCFAGLPDGDKDAPDVIVRAFHGLRRDGAALRIIGMTEAEFTGAYPDCPVDPRIEFMGRLTHAQTIARVMGSGCCIFVRRPDLRNNAGFPTKFVEYYTCGAPIIACDVSDVRSYMDERRCGIVTRTTDAREIRRAMEYMMDHAAELRRPLSDRFHYEAYRAEAEEWLMRTVEL